MTGDILAGWYWAALRNPLWWRPESDLTTLAGIVISVRARRIILLHYFDEGLLGLLSDLQTITTPLSLSLSTTRTLSATAADYHGSSSWRPQQGDPREKWGGQSLQVNQVKEWLQPTVCFRPWWDMMEDNLLYFFVIMSEFAQCGWTYYVVSMLPSLRYGDTAHDIPLQHTARLHCPPFSVAKLDPRCQDPPPHSVCPELR